MAKIKKQITIEDELLERASSYADNHYMSVSTFACLAISEYLNTKELQIAVKELNLTMKQIAERGSVDEDTKQKLKDFEVLANAFTSL